MIEHIKMVCALIIEAIKERKVTDIFHDQVWNCRIAVPVELKLSDITQNVCLDQVPSYHFIELSLDELVAKDLTFCAPSRRYKALRNLKRGLRGYALVRNSVVLVDAWCVLPRGDGIPVYHPDLKMLGITFNNGDAYALDMYVAPDCRGKNIAIFFQRQLQSELWMKNCKKMYAYYWADNIPAMWMHRILKYKELPKREVYKFFFIMRAKESK